MNPEQQEESKARLRREMVTAGIAIVTACCIILFYFCVKRYQGFGEIWNEIFKVLEPIIIGFAMAFLMNPITKFLERRLYPLILRWRKDESRAKKSSRMICSVLALLFVVGIIALILVFVIPEMYNTIYFLVTHISEQINGVLDWANMITGGRYEKSIMGAKDSDIQKTIEDGMQLLRTYMDVETEDMISMVATSVIGVGRFLVDVIIGIIVSVYVLCSKETFKGQAKKILYGIFKTEHANVIMEIYRKAADIFYGFLIGKLIDSFIIGVICYVVMIILHMPYPLLVSVIIGVTNIIPVFGPYIGAVPTVIIIFLTEPMQGIYFLIFVIILQQVDGNIIGPKILGDSTGLSSFWVVVAIVVGGGLFGFPGMLLGVPTMALLYYLTGRFSKYLLRRRCLPENTEDYINLERIDTNTNAMVQHPAEYQDRSRSAIFKKNKKTEKENDSEGTPSA